MNPTEFDIFISSLQDRMYRFARTMLGGQADAEDAVSDVVERLWRRHRNIDSGRNASSLAMTSVRNACLDRLRRRSEVLPERMPEAEAENPDRDLRECVREAIACLPRRQREALHLRDIEGYPISEIASMLSTDEANVRMMLSRARRKLKEIIEKTTDYGK